MGEPAWTPGPWEAVLQDDPRGQPVPHYSGLICLISDGEERMSVVASDGFARSTEWAPNAGLISAAPELYEALVLILPLAKGYAPEGQSDTARATCRSWIEAAESAVAKARGGE